MRGSGTKFVCDIDKTTVVKNEDFYREGLISLDCDGGKSAHVYANEAELET